MPLPPILYHIFPSPLPYLSTLRLQNTIHSLQLANRHKSPPAHSDYLLLLQHTPVYTAGRRMTEDTLARDRERLTGLGADFVKVERGGQYTYHGPGQLVGYPLVDLSRTAGTNTPISVREYVCILQRALKSVLLTRHGIVPSPGALAHETGVFVDEGRTKLASVGVQVRHRLTSHGVAMNVTREPLAWFDEVVACGLEGVRAGCVEEKGKGELKIKGGLSVDGEARAFAEAFGREMGRKVRPLVDVEFDRESDEIRSVKALVTSMEDVAEKVNEDRGPDGWKMRD
jgi:lipoyl(octanoyl) transferase